MTNIIEPRILQGTRDFGQVEKAKRDFVMAKIVEVFRRFGYSAIETPSIEYAETLLGKYGADADRLVYRFEDNGGRDIALKYDQTVPTARYVAANLNELPMPFKRYQIDRVWRAERPQKGRYREFWQCDIDVLGVTNVVADSEVAVLGVTVFEELGVPVVCKINNRKFLNSVLSKIGVPSEREPEVIRVIDKLDKIGRDGVKTELVKIVSDEQSARLLEVILVEGTNEEKLETLKEYQTGELREFFKICREFGIGERLSFEPSLARGLDYYTGTIYEFVCPTVKVGSICGGGRYDNLCGVFTKAVVPGVGVAIGFDRTMVVMEELGLLNDVKSGAKVLVTQFDEQTRPESVAVIRKLWDLGVSAELYTGDDLKLAKQFKYADRKGIPYVAVCGPEEVKKNAVLIKEMTSGNQTEVQLDSLKLDLFG